MSTEENAPKNFGTLTAGHGTSQQRELAITAVVRADYADHRLITIMGIEDGSIVVTVESPATTGRNPHQQMWLSRESLIGILCTTHMFLSSTGSDLMQLVKDAAGDETIRYSFGGTKPDPGEGLALDAPTEAE